MNIPHAEVYDYKRLQKKSLVFDVFVVRSKGSGPEKVVFLIDNVEYPEDGLKHGFQWQLDAHDYSERKFIVARLFVDSGINMERIYELKRILRDVGIFRIYFVMKKTRDNCNQPEIGEYGVLQKILPKLMPKGSNKVDAGNSVEPPPLQANFLSVLKTQFENGSLLILNIESENKFTLNSEAGKLNKLKSVLEEEWEPGFRIILESEDDVKYKNYIQAFAQVENFIFEKRNLFSQKYFGVGYQDIYERAQTKKVRKDVPYFLVFDPEDLDLVLERR